MTTAKQIVIENAQFAYLLYVNGRRIGAIQGVDFFKEHFLSLGYTVVEVSTHQLDDLEVQRTRERIFSGDFFRPSKVG